MTPLNFIKPKKVKKKSIQELKKELWRLFSKWIRERDQHLCYTCGKPAQHAGHYVPQSKGNALRYDERNVHAQCISCNSFKRGNLVPYALRLERDYGPGILQEFEQIKNTVYKPTHDELIVKMTFGKWRIP
jgi:5-methylcytosine-specific restriction endonuclease McrA